MTTVVMMIILIYTIMMMRVTAPASSAVDTLPPAEPGTPPCSLQCDFDCVIKMIHTPPCFLR
jgi:hypothetical protein